MTNFMANIRPEKILDIPLTVSVSENLAYKEQHWDFVSNYLSCTLDFLQANLDNFRSLILDGHGAANYPKGIEIKSWEHKRHISVPADFIDGILEVCT